METSWLPVVTTLAGTLAGYWLAGVSDVRRDRLSAQREEAKDQRTAADSAARDRRQFQLTNLLELQGALQLMARLNGRALHFDHMHARRGLLTQLPEGWSEEMHNNGVDVSRLNARVLDEETRAAVENFARTCAVLTTSPKAYEGLVDDAAESVAIENMRQLANEVAALMEQVGGQIRALLDP